MRPTLLAVLIGAMTATGSPPAVAQGPALAPPVVPAETEATWTNSQNPSRTLPQGLREPAGSPGTPMPVEPSPSEVQIPPLPPSASADGGSPGTFSITGGIGRPAFLQSLSTDELATVGQEVPVIQKEEQKPNQLELQRQQIDLLNRMIKLMGKQLEQQAPLVDQLQTKVATLEARSKQSAQRDQELAIGVTNLTEQQDAMWRTGPIWPTPLKELFLPSNTNETPLSIYGALAVGYSRINGDAGQAANGAGRPNTPGGFYFGEFTPDFLLKLNDWIFLSAEIGIGGDGSVSAGSFAEADFFINDWLTITAGRFVAPIGWYNLRLNNPWVNKLPGDAPGSGPLLWQQVLPPMSLLGLQASGAFYLANSPIKLDYNVYVSNGLNVTPKTAGAPTLSELANLQNMTNTFSFITNDKLIGGRLGLWWPEVGLAGGISGLCNGDYIAGGYEDQMYLWAIDLNYHHGNWDARFEYGKTYQQAANFLGTPIWRQGLYGQLAYRPRDVANRYLQNVEGVYRYSFVEFGGIDPTALDLTTFTTPMDVPVRRQQHEIGLNYWLAPRAVIKFAYQLNDEIGFHLHDNQFITELAWGW
jgi:hypothetical protein